MKPICFRCKNPIMPGQSIVAFNRYWHKDCFICDNCQKPLDVDSAELIDGFLLHLTCLPKRRNQLEKKPSWLIAGERKGNLETRINYTKPVYQRLLDLFLCKTCKKPIGTEKFIHVKGNYFHTKCFLDNNTPICEYCNNHIVGKFIITRWGNTYCYSHMQDNLKCDECGRPLIGSIHNRLSDGRLLCDQCSSSCIISQSQLINSIVNVRDILGKNGLLIDERLFPVKFLKPTKQIKGRKRIVTGHIKKIIYGNGHREIEGVYVMSHRPKLFFECILAHEFGHAWFFINHVDNLPLHLEEGLCNILYYLVARDSMNYESLAIAQNLFIDDDPVYGEGFRNAEAFLYNYSVGSLMRYVKQHHALPKR